MSKISTPLLNLAIKYNDYVNIKKMLDDNPDFHVKSFVLKTAIDYKFVKCFDLIVDRIIFDEKYTDKNKNYIDVTYEKAIDIYNSCKNEENEYFIKKLLEKNLIVDPKIVIDFLYKYNIDIFNNYIDTIINTNYHTKEYCIKNLLIKLLHNDYFTYFLNIFNNVYNLEQQTKFVHDNLYNINGIYANIGSYEDECNNSKAYTYFLNNPIYEYNNILDKPYEPVSYGYNGYLITRLFYYGINMPRVCIDYFVNKPADFSQVDSNNFFKSLMHLYYHNYNYLFLVSLVKKNIVTKPLIINCQPINLLHYMIINDNDQYYEIHHNIDTLKMNLILFFHILNKLGLNFDIYAKLNNNFLSTIKNIRTRENVGGIIEYGGMKKLIEVVRFGRYIGQDIPEKFRKVIYEYCHDNLLDTPVTDIEIQELMKSI